MENVESLKVNTKIKLDFKDSKYATGRRKTSIAKSWLKKGSGKIYINGNGGAAQPEQDSRMGEESFTVSLKKNSLHSSARKHVMYSLPDISPVLPQSPVLLTEKT